jgi:hypothetical protein
MLAGMASPFPGMDPWLEEPALWPDVHARLIAELGRVLGPILRPRYVVRIEERTYVDADGLVLVGRPDLAVQDRGTSVGALLEFGQRGVSRSEDRGNSGSTAIGDEVAACSLDLVDESVSPRDFARFLNVSEGSLAEVEYLLMLSRDLGHVDEQTVRPHLDEASEIARMLHALRRKVENEP